MDRHDLPRPLRRRFALLIATSIVVSTLVALPSCSSVDRGPIILGYDLEEGGAAPSFTQVADSGPDGANDLIEYCPSDNCPAGHTTCPSSNFPCEVDLRKDRNNCGACGVACPTEANNAKFDCKAGRCVLACADFTKLDCDGVPDNGCEIDATTNANCGDCGNECTDPVNSPCVFVSGHYQCGCPSGLTYCPSIRSCVDLTRDDAHCGACDHPCDPTGGGRALLPRTRWSCGNGTCVERITSPDDPTKEDMCAPIAGGPIRKCESDLWGDCSQPDVCNSDGCETYLFTEENCGSCGNSCKPGQTCRPSLTGAPFCACSEGETYCTVLELGSIVFGGCFDLTTDINHCSACNSPCPNSRANAKPACVYGTCTFNCIDEYADCNGNADDGCEVDTLTDPRNCGGCGITCDAVAGQACVGGRCFVEPCDRPGDAGVPAR